MLEYPRWVYKDGASKLVSEVDKYEQYVKDGWGDVPTAAPVPVADISDLKGAAEIARLQENVAALSDENAELKIQLDEALTLLSEASAPEAKKGKK